ncbi:uncharacterized protein N7529_007880 [Penicillium soppii]|uniref:uncharacterized protein n=1 Tax=Penicillium soppii TaxID=69789 RepID=UPI002546F759|nr:uncharacterized protein N7529_007880 [Penicillium soppii]KAJ5860570.1 hypothetical protein N7529_007880 [Penicillium soppii]
MDNSGECALRVPGINAIPVNYELDVNERFANKGHVPRLTRPEVLLRRLIEHVTDKKNWEQDIFDENAVTEWYTEAKLDSTLGSDLRYEWDIDFDMDLVSANTWNWCIQELRDKALYFIKKGYVLTLNADSDKRGRTAKPFIDRREDPGDSPHTDHIYQSISLQDNFREQGLQIIVRVSSIDLTPENPTFQGDDDFHVKGLLNEHIAGVTRYYYDVENITDTRIPFQQEDDLDPFEFRLGVDAMHKIFGLPLFEGEECYPQKLQTLGSVGTN